MTKKELRKQMKDRNLSLPAPMRSEASARIFSAIERLPVFSTARCVAIYCSLPDEPATEAVLARWALGRRVVVPRVEGMTMQFYDYAPATMCRGALGITEPGLGVRRCDPDEIDLVVVPGTAFTAAGARMGRGKGFYDRYLAHADLRALKVGVCYAHQVVGELPVEAHDVAMDCVVSG